MCRQESGTDAQGYLGWSTQSVVAVSYGQDIMGAGRKVCRVRDRGISDYWVGECEG